ncbi:MAG TPA: alpha/beta fold hydrolase [Gemmatimonadaceae bacterium]|nr:alpha/beta fold hydrolase [Gemmatimonadaceae bacterium]
MRGEFVDVGGVRLYYYAAGSRGAGEPIVLIHGFPTSSHLWREVVPLLPSGRRVVVLDLLGYGRSDRPMDHDLSIKGHAERVIALLDALRIQYAAIAGHDLGGGIAQYLAVRHPTRVERLCLIDSVGFDEWPTRQIKMAQATLPLTRHLPTTWILSALRSEMERGYTQESRGERSMDIYIRPFCSPEGRDVLVQHLEALDPEETVALAPRLGEIMAPTAVITGAHDPFINPSVARQLHEAIPNSTLDVLPDVRHFTPEESPEAISTIMEQWLKRER